MKSTLYIFLFCRKIMPTLDNMLTVCYGCRTLIDDRYYLMAVDRSWHLSCLKCFDCGMSLEQERTCFARFGQIFCKDDYIKYVVVVSIEKTKSFLL